MKRFFALAVSAILLVSFNASAEPKKEEKKEFQKEATATDEKKQIVKKGWNFAPFPSIGYNSDTGFQIGALCAICRGQQKTRLSCTSSTTRSTLSLRCVLRQLLPI